MYPRGRNLTKWLRKNRRFPSPAASNNENRYEQHRIRQFFSSLLDKRGAYQVLLPWKECEEIGHGFCVIGSRILPESWVADFA